MLPLPAQNDTRQGFLRLALTHASPLHVALLASTVLLPELAGGTARAQTAPFVYVANEFINTVSVIDTATNTVAPTTVPVGVFPSAVAVRGDQSLVYVANQRSPVSVIDTATNTVVANVNAEPVATGVAISPDGKTVYVTNVSNVESFNNVSVIDTATNTVVATIFVGAVGSGSPYGVAVSPDGKFAYVTVSGSTILPSHVEVISTATNTVVANVTVGTSPQGVVVSPDSAHVYVTDRASGTVSVINTASNTVVATINVGFIPEGVAVNPNGKFAYVANAGSNTLSVIDTATNTVFATINVGAVPESVAVSPDGKFAYVTNRFSDTVSVIDTAANTVIASLPVGNLSEFPGALGICTNGNALLAGGLTFRANTSGALACTLASGPNGATGPVFTGGTMQFAGAGIASPLPISLMAAGGTFDTAGNNATLSGPISGPGGLTKIGLGTLTLSGASTYAGPTIVNAGTLQGGAVNAFSPNSAYTIAAGATLDLNSFNQTIGSLAGAGAVTLGAAILTTGVDNTSTTFSGAISGTGGFTKAGTGTITLSGLSTYTGPTTVTAGTLTVSSTGGITSDVTNNATFSNAGTVTGSLTNTGTATNSGTISNGLTNTGGVIYNTGSIGGTTTITGGVLTGNGTVASLSIGNGGTFAPGTGVAGTSTTVSGSLALTSGAIYLVQINPSTASFANVSGVATLGNATLKAVYASGSYVAKQYLVLNATGGVSGTFNSVVNTNLPTNFHATLSYDANNAYLNLLLNFILSPNGGLNRNQQNVANAVVGFFNSNGTIPVVFGGLTPAGLTQVAGEVATGSQQTTFDAMGMFMGLLTDPFVAGRGDPVSAGASMAASAYASQDKPGAGAARDAYAAIYRKAPVVADPFTQRWSVWAASYGGSQTTDGNATLGSNNTTSGIFGTAVGADYRLSPYTLAGFALAGGGTNFSVANNLGSGRSDLFQAGAFIRHNAGAAYFSGALAYGWQDITTNRTVTVAGIDQLRAQFNANAWSGRVEGGYRFVSPYMGGIGITPYAAGQFTTFDLPAYAEQALVGTNTFALAYVSQSVTASRNELGLRSDKSFAMLDGIFTVRGRAAWAHDFNTDRVIGATFQTLPGASFVVNGAAQAPDAVLVTASAEMKWLNGWSAAATFEGEFSSDTTSYAGKGVVRYSW